MRIEGKTVILTGAARIGRELGKMLLEEGANLVVTYLDSLAEVEDILNKAAKIQRPVEAVHADLSREEDVKKVVEAAKNKFSHFHGLVHMVAIYPRTPFETLRPADWDLSMNVIARSAFLLAKAAGDELLQNEGEEVRGEDGEIVGRVKGKIITIADWSVLTRPYKDYLPYNTAKGAVIALTKSLAKELAPQVLVNSIAPGPILRPEGLTERENQEVLSHTPLGRWGGPEEIAKAVHYLFETDFVTGQVLVVDGGRTIA